MLPFGWFLPGSSAYRVGTYGCNLACEFCLEDQLSRSSYPAGYDAPEIPPEDIVENALRFDRKALVEEFIHGREVEVAVLGNDTPVASVCGEIDAGAEFYDYETKYLTDTSTLYIPARISEQAAEEVRQAAVRIYRATGCSGLARVDFFVGFDDERVVFNEINTLPGFTSISMYPKLFEASGIPYGDLLDRLISLALEARYGL